MESQGIGQEYLPTLTQHCLHALRELTKGGHCFACKPGEILPVQVPLTGHQQSRKGIDGQELWAHVLHAAQLTQAASTVRAYAPKGSVGSQ